jgi:hypothetical protein
MDGEKKSRNQRKASPDHRGERRPQEGRPRRQGHLGRAPTATPTRTTTSSARTAAKEARDDDE